jgi:PAS domain S-box-containing protein
MKFIFSIFEETIYLNWPTDGVGMLGWILLLFLWFALLWFWRGYNRRWSAQAWQRFLGYLILVPLSGWFIGLRLPATGILPSPGVSLETQAPLVMLFASVPWLLAAGYMGPLAASLLGAASGWILALWDTHSAFTILEYALLGTVAGAMFRQSYRSTFYRALRQPIASVLSIPWFYTLISFLGRLASTDGSFAVRLDYAISHVGLGLLALTINLAASGLVVQIISRIWPQDWGGTEPWVPTPIERSLQVRFFFIVGTTVGLLTVGLVIGNWKVAGDAASDMMRSRLESSGDLVARNVPLFLEAGQNLLTQIARDPRLLSASREELPAVLAEDMRSIPFFRQLTLLNARGEVITGYPRADLQVLYITPEELNGITLALQGVPIQIYTVPPVPGEKAAQISFLTYVQDETGDYRNVLLGRTDLLTNPMTESLIRSLESLADAQGEGWLIDDRGQILYHPDPTQVMAEYSGQRAAEPFFFIDTGPDGAQRLVYYRPTTGSPWAVLLAVPTEQTQRLALRITVPLLLMLLAAGMISFGAVSLIWSNITRSLQHLGQEASHIAEGHLNRPLAMERVDEIGRLRQAFEQMRVSLKSRMDELNRLLKASRGAVATLEVQGALEPILEAAWMPDMAAARMVLVPEKVPSEIQAGLPTRWGVGPLAARYKELDDHLLSLMRNQQRLVLNTTERSKQFASYPPEVVPGALLAVSLRQETDYYGVLWVAYEEPREFTDEQMQFITALGIQASMAVANTVLFLNAEIGRQQLAAILASTPDPVLVTDDQNRLLFLNPAARHELGLFGQQGIGQPISQVVEDSRLIEMMQADASGGHTAEVQLPNRKFYFAAVSPVVADGKNLGRVCVLRDVTHFKELDTMKSDFVATVSHDLRSPLNLMKGYSTMLERVGDLNPQQRIYLRKIIDGVDKMVNMITNLLDLGRLETGLKLELEVVSVAELVDQVISEAKPVADQKKIRLIKNIAPDTIPLLEADKTLLQRALQNLVDNAVKYTRREGQVTVHVKSGPEGMTFAVEDTGIGIAPVDQPRVFEKFYRAAHQEADEKGGEGLGLAIVKSIIERHKGRVWVESQLGKGSMFYMQLPFRHEDDS